MVSWKVISEDICPLSKLADSLGDEVSRLNGSIFALSYDGLVKRECNGRDTTPCSVDCVCLTDDTTYFIEYKRESDKKIDEIHQGYECKCRETLLIYDRFIRHDPERKRVLVIVTQDVRDTIAQGSTARSSSGFIPEPLKRYQKKDRKKQPLFYDEIVLRTTGKFVSYANKNMTSSTCDNLLKAYMDTIH